MGASWKKRRYMQSDSAQTAARQESAPMDELILSIREARGLPAPLYGFLEKIPSKDVYFTWISRTMGTAGVPLVGKLNQRQLSGTGPCCNAGSRLNQFVAS